MYVKVQTKISVENIVAKGGIAHHEQFPNLSQYFQKMSATDGSKCHCVSEMGKG